MNSNDRTRLPEIARCPVCNGFPRVIIYSGMTVIKCKRMFRNTHLRTYGRGQNTDDNTRRAIQEWNARVEKYKT